MRGGRESEDRPQRFRWTFGLRVSDVHSRNGSCPKVPGLFSFFRHPDVPVHLPGPYVGPSDVIYESHHSGRLFLV